MDVDTIGKLVPPSSAVTCLDIHVDLVNRNISITKNSWQKLYVFVNIEQQFLL